MSSWLTLEQTLGADGLRIAPVRAGERIYNPMSARKSFTSSRP